MTRRGGRVCSRSAWRVRGRKRPSSVLTTTTAASAAGRVSSGHRRADRAAPDRHAGGDVGSEAGAHAGSLRGRRAASSLRRSAMSSRRAAVIVVNWNEGRFLERTLADLDRQTVPPERTILVDNGSEDGSLEMVRERFPHVEVVELGENAGATAANNTGVEAAAGCDWVALLHPDAYPQPGSLAALLRA